MESVNRQPASMAMGKELEALAEKEVLQSLVAVCPDGIIGVDREGLIIIFNHAAERLSGYTADEVVGKMHITDFYNPPDWARTVKKAMYSKDFGGPGRVQGMEVEVGTTAGRRVPIRLSAAILYNGDQEIGSVGFFHDMTLRKEMEEQLRRHSITDSLTGLYNRRHLYAVLNEEVSRAHRYNRPLTLVMLDLDNFKPFNDHYGHHEGDNILKLVGHCARQCLRNNDNAFRHGGDEFALVLVETPLERGVLAAERFRSFFREQWGAAMSYLGGRLDPVGFSLGVSALQEGERVDKLVLRADLAMYEAKKAGGDRTVQAGPEIGVASSEHP